MNPNLSEGAKTFLEGLARAGGKVTDGPVPASFTSGWAVAPFVGKRAHYWTKVQPRDGIKVALSACNRTALVTERAPLLGVGSFERCSLCDAKVLRSMKVSR